MYDRTNMIQCAWACMTKSRIPYQYYPHTISLYYRCPTEYQKHEQVGVPTPALCAVLLPSTYCAPISFTSSSLEVMGPVQHAQACMTQSGISYQYYPCTVSLYYCHPTEYQKHE